MIALLVGTIESVDFMPSREKAKSASVVIMTEGGVGYDVAFSVADGFAFERRFTSGHRADRHVRASIRETWSETNGAKLFGFEDPAARSFFDRLVDIPGIGGGRALEVTGCIDAAGFDALVKAGDVKSLSKLKGIGTKGAENLIAVWK